MARARPLAINGGHGPATLLTQRPARTRHARSAPRGRRSDASSSVLGPRLRAIRLRRGLSLRELAGRLDLSPSSISQIETGKSQPSMRTLYALVSELGVTVDEVLFDQTPPSPDAASASVPSRPRPRQGPGSRCSARRTTGHHPRLRGDVGAADVLGGRGRRVHRGDLPAGRASGPDDALVRHSGHEFGYILSGTCASSSDSTSSSSGPATRSPSPRRPPPARQRGQRDASHLGRPRPARCHHQAPDAEEVSTSRH